MARPSKPCRTCAISDVSYVVLCADRPLRGTDNSVRTRLLRDEAPEFLREFHLPQGTPIRIWKVTPAP